MKLKYSFLKLGLALMLVPLSAPAVPADAMLAQDGETIILRPRDNETGGAPPYGRTVLRGVLRHAVRRDAWVQRIHR